jgi:cerevisin
MKGAIAIVLAALATATPAFASISVGTIHGGAAPLLSSTAAEEIPGHYIIKFKDHVTEGKAAEHHSWVQQLHEDGEDRRLELRKRGLDSVVDIFSGVKHTYKIAEGFLGYAGHFDDETIEEVRRHPDVSRTALF